MKMKILTASILAITLAGCGGDGEDVFEAPANTSSAGPVENVPATFTGLTGTTNNSTAGAVAGLVSVTDLDEGEDAVVPLTNESTMYGTFSIEASGVWSYTVDASDTTVAGLADADDSVVDSIELESVDGTTATLEITITGASEAVETSQVARITDSMTSDAGELRYKFGEALEQGKLTASFMKDDNAETADGSAKDAYIGLYGTSTSTSQALVDLRIQEDQFVIRDQDDIEVSIPFEPGVWTDVEMTWDASAADASTPPLVTITINGESVTTDPFSSAASVLTNVEAGVEVVIFKLGDDGSVLPDAAYHVDNVKVFSDIAGTEVAFEDDFESYEAGTKLDPDENADSVYHSNSAEVEVAAVAVNGTGGGGTGAESGPGAAGNKVARMTDSMTNDNPELRYKLDEAMVEGKITAYFNKDDMAETADGVAKDAYIGLFGNSTSTNPALLDLRIQADQYVIRNKDYEVPVVYEPAVWNYVEITWDASEADASTPPLLTITINGEDVTDEPFMSTSSILTAVENGVEVIAFRFGDTSSVLPTAQYRVDEFKLYSDKEGTVLEFEDDFESYDIGISLDPDVNEGSIYHSNSEEVVIDVE
ncbi:VCBS domain-containing protein [Gilvimarinus agarilyticus]|uniref:VCBS domain-containing protein n=1 Tax=Gilvimarinus sp. 2_MG-2023 TaxID=3062666 RepID=UPI001C0901AC|nr:VCBS domain-containing protein [Gilvimarinus sp. 2_MG-2023]MBU2886526.1 VCBS domain-containing protein [Gilvimarinus agarilyticus]MDO6571194.1 VCBS domain-containing protein [Gilvimarinus sp. 2_MG-2023]